MAEPRHVLAMLAANARQTPDKRAFGFLGRDGELVRALDFAGLHAVVTAQAEAYRTSGLQWGNRVVISLPAGLEFVTSFLAVLAVGGVAVPLPSPSGRAALERVAGMIRHAAPHFAITATPGDAEPRLVPDCVAQLSPPDLDAQVESAGPSIVDPVHEDGERSDLALLQYTSGSTSFPKAVEVTHGMLSHNIDCIQRAFQHDASSIFVNWLPHFHDMGLIGTILQPVYCGAISYLMAPTQFIRNPLSWLQAVSDRRATTSGAPNFAYDLCVTALQEEEAPPALDLSCWKVAFNGSEPVRASTMRVFAEAFRRFGFRPCALFPCYGTAENGLFVSGGPVGSGVVTHTLADGQKGEEAVSSGVTGHGQEVVIVDPGTARELDDGAVGEIWIRGASTARRYFRNEEDSAIVLKAQLEGRGGPFLRTGDLGFMHDGRLYVTGRLKDIIIVNGRNLYPEDIEALALDLLPDKGRVRVAAFGVESGASERVVLLVSGLRARGAPPGDLLDRIRDVIFDAFEGLNAEVLTAPRAMVPVTSSGKIRRAACKQNYLRGRIAQSGDSCTEAETLQGALKAVQAILGRPPRSEEMALSPLALGFDSLKLARLAERLDRLGVAPPQTSVLARLSLSEIATLEAKPKGGPSTADETWPQPVRASLNQQSYAFQEMVAPEHPRSILGFTLSLEGPLTGTQISEALGAVLRRHSALSLCIGRDGALRAGEAVAPAHYRVDTSRAAEALASDLIRKPMPLFDAALCNVHLIESPGTALLMMQIHHAACDFFSLGILMDDLRAALAGEALAEPAPDYRTFVREQVRYLNGPAAADASARWRERLLDQPLIIAFPKLRLAAPRLYADAPMLRLRIDEAETARIGAFARRHEVTVYSVLLVAFGITLSRFSGQDRLTIASPFHGRNFARDAHTVGLFENLLPIALRLPGSAGFRETVQNQFAEIAAMLDDGALPLSRIQHHFSAPRPLVEQGFDAMFTLQSALGQNARALSEASLRKLGARFDLGPMTAELVDVTDIAVETGLDLCVTAAETIDGYLAYNPEVVSEQTARRLLTAFELILSAGVGEPDMPISRLSVLSEEERAMLLKHWAIGPGARRPYRIAPELFNRAAACHPDKIAVSDARRALTYRELAAEVDRLAALLQGLDRRKAPH